MKSTNRLYDQPELKIIREDDKHVFLSNGDIIYQGYGIYQDRWLIDSKKRRDRAKDFLKINPKGVCVTSWFLKARNRREALSEYQNLTGRTKNESNRKI